MEKDTLFMKELIRLVKKEGRIAFDINGNRISVTHETLSPKTGASLQINVSLKNEFLFAFDKNGELLVKSDDRYTDSLAYEVLKEIISRIDILNEKFKRRVNNNIEVLSEFVADKDEYVGYGFNHD